LKTGEIHTRPTLPKTVANGFQNRFSVFFVFLFFTTLIWLTVKLSKDFTSTLTYQLEFANPPSDLILIDYSDSTIQLGIDARGFELLRHRMKKKSAAVIVDLSGIRLIQTGEVVTGTLPTHTLNRKLSAQLGLNRELLFLNPDTLYFMLLLEHSKKIPVTAHFSFDLRAQHMLYDSISIEPDSIFIYGPQSIIDTISAIETHSRNFSDLNESLHASLSLKTYDHLPLKYSHNTVGLNFVVERFTERSITIPITVVCTGGSFTMRVFPEDVTIHCLVAMRDYRRIDPAMFEATVECRPNETPTPSTLRVQLKNYPSFVKVTRIEPERVEYIMVQASR
jgi:hypothetical protein